MLSLQVSRYHCLDKLFYVLVQTILNFQSSANGLAFNAGQIIWLSGWLNAINENNNSLFLNEEEIM